MGTLFSSSYRREEPERRAAINQIYNVEYGSAPIGPIGSIASTPKRYMYNNNNTGFSRRHRRGRRYWYLFDRIRIIKIGMWFDYQLYKQAKIVPILICCLNIHEHWRRQKLNDDNENYERIDMSRKGIERESEESSTKEKHRTKNPRQSLYARQ